MTAWLGFSREFLLAQLEESDAQAGFSLWADRQSIVSPTQTGTVSYDDARFTVSSIADGVSASATSTTATGTKPETLDSGGKFGLAAGLSTDLARAVQAEIERDALSTNANGASGGSGGSLIAAEAVFADVSAGDVESALEMAGIDWRGINGEPAFTITEILTAAGTIRTFVYGHFQAENLASLSTLLPDAGVSGRLIGASTPQFITSVGATTSQGDQAQQSDDARTNFGVDGTGISVGILSDSFGTEVGGDGTTPTTTTVVEDIASGDLPDDVNVLQEGTSIASFGDEGRAMAQIVHDVAPGADILFHTANFGQANFAQGITDLANAGADIIVDDIIYLAEPIFQDGIIAQSVTNYYNAGGTYFSSAGNNGNDGFLDVFRSSGVDGNTVSALEDVLGPGVALGDLHDWNDDPTVFAPYLQLTAPGGSSFSLSFQWDEAFASAGGAGSTSDLDIYITEVDAMGTETIVDSSITNNIGGDAVEIVEVEDEGDTDKTYRIYITEFDAPDDVAANVIAGVFLGIGGDLIEDFDPVINDQSGDFRPSTIGSPTSYGHNNAVGALSVGASAYFFTPEFGVDPPRINQFSSQAGFDILFDAAGNRLAVAEQRDNVDFVAPDGGNTTFFGNDADSDGFGNFFGTSAAAPHAAAVAALLLESVPTLTNDQIETLLEDSATAITLSNQASVRDATFTGTGLIDANAALAAAQSLGGNEAPEAFNDDFSVDENSLISGENVLSDNGNGADSDADGDTLTVVSVNGDPLLVGTSVALIGDSSVQVDGDGTFSFDTGTAYEFLSIGQSDFATITYTISDGSGGEATATVNVTIQGENDLPTIENLTLFAEASVTGLNIDLLSLASDVDLADTLALTALDLTGTAGSVVDNGDGTVVYDANGAFDTLAGGDFATDTIGFSISDGTATVDGSVQLIIVDQNIAPDAPDADLTVSEATTAELIDLLANVTDANSNAGDFATLQSISTVSTLGIVTDNGDGTVSYDTNGVFNALLEGQTATDTFEYTVVDQFGATATGLVTITIEGAPNINAVDDSGTVVLGATVVVDVLANDTSSNGDIFIGGFSTTDTGGRVTGFSGAEIEYTALVPELENLALNAVATDSFTYELVDIAGERDNATVSIDITGTREATDLDDTIFGGVSTDDVISGDAGNDLLFGDGEVDVADLLASLGL